MSRDYEALEQIGAGGMAETFIGVRRGPGGFVQRVCLKRILPHLSQDPELVLLFEEEARMTASLSHANITRMLDFRAHGEAPYLVFELIEGTDMRALLRAWAARGERLGAWCVAYLAEQLAHALQYAHEHNVIHRDVSPSNVLLSLSGEVKLTDFGIAKAFGSPNLTRTGIVKGKVPYMAPEYARSGTATPASDMFSLGVTLYEALAGVRPFIGRTELDVLTSIAKGEHIPLPEKLPDVAPELCHTIERLIAHDPRQRIQSAPELLEALMATAPPPTARRMLSQVVKQHHAERVQREAVLPFAQTSRVDVGDTQAIAVHTRIDETPDVRTDELAEVTRTRIASGESAPATRPAEEEIPATKSVAIPKAQSKRTGGIVALGLVILAVLALVIWGVLQVL